MFRIRPDRPWSPISLLYNGNRLSFPAVERPGRGLNHQPPFSAEDKKKKKKNHTSTSSVGLHSLLLGEIYFLFDFIMLQEMSYGGVPHSAPSRTVTPLSVTLGKKNCTNTKPPVLAQQETISAQKNSL
jgi:hypothetical protein